MYNKNLSTYNVYLYNSIEDEWDFISSFKKNEQKKLIHDSNRFADCYLFANAYLPSFTLITPNRISAEFKEYFEELSGAKCEVQIPKPKTPFLCDNIIFDKELFLKIVSHSKKLGSLTIYTYVSTPNIYTLKRAFEAAGVIVYLPEAPKEKDVWTVSHFGSKSGFRESFASVMPPGTVERDYKIVQKKAAELFENGDGVVLKTDKGNAGQGIHIFRKKTILTKDALSKKVTEVFKKELFLKKHPIVLESYIDTSKEKKSPFPSVECFIHQNGKIEIPYFCNMIVTSEGEFYGMEMHSSVLSKKTKKNVLSITNKIANKYKESGYRGRFDIDMINNGKTVYANESNTRTNGGTDTYIMIKKLIGANFFSSRYILSSYTDLPKNIRPSFTVVKELFLPYLFNKKTKTGLIINSESVIKNGGFSYILIGKNKKEALKLHEIVKSTLTNKKNKQ